MLVACPLLAEEILPSSGKERRFFDLLRESAPLPGDRRSGIRSIRSIHSRDIAAVGEIEGYGIDLLLGAAEVEYVGFGEGKLLVVVGPEATVHTPIPTAPAAGVREPWQSVIFALSDGSSGSEEARFSLGMIQAESSAREDPRTWVLSGLVAFQAGDLMEARDHFGHGAALGPQDPLPLCLQGLMEVLIGEPQLAIAPLLKARAVAPDAFPPNALLGKAYVRLGRHSEAIPPLQTAVTARPGDVGLRLILARSLVRFGRPNDALAQLKRIESLSLKPPAGVRSPDRSSISSPT